MSHTQQASRTQRVGLTLAARACSSGPLTAACWRGRPRGLHHVVAELSTGRVHRLVHGCGGLWDVAILPVRNAGSRPPHWASTPAEAPGPGRHAPWDRIPRYRVLAENPGIPSDQSHSHSRESRGRPSTAATAHSSSSCNLSAVTSGSPERAIAPPSPQFYTGARRICG